MKIKEQNEQRIVLVTDSDSEDWTIALNLGGFVFVAGLVLFLIPQPTPVQVPRMIAIALGIIWVLFFLSIVFGKKTIIDIATGNLEFLRRYLLLFRGKTVVPIESVARIKLSVYEKRYSSILIGDVLEGRLAGHTKEFHKLSLALNTPIRWGLFKKREVPICSGAAHDNRIRKLGESIAEFIGKPFPENREVVSEIWSERVEQEKKQED